MGYPRKLLRSFASAGSTTFTCPAGVKKLDLSVRGGSTGASNFQRGDVTFTGAINTTFPRYDVVLTPSTTYNLVVGSGTGGFVKIYWVE